MKRKPVISSVLKSIGYNTETMTLEVEFTGQQDVYQYHGVSKDVYDELMRASSHGKYFNTNIKDHYSFTKKNRA
jgi:hypothetical protein